MSLHALGLGLRTTRNMGSLYLTISLYLKGPQSQALQEVSARALGMAADFDFRREFFSNILSCDGRVATEPLMNSFVLVASVPVYYENL